MLSSRDKISVRQAVILFLMSVYSASIRLFSAYAAKAGERAGWLTPIFSILPFICLIFIIQALFKKNKDANLSDVIFKALGKIPGTALLILYLIWMMIFLGLNVRYFAERFLTSLLPNTPSNFFIVTILAAVFYALRSGIVYISRTVEYFFWYFPLFLLLFLYFLYRI